MFISSPSFLPLLDMVQETCRTYSFISSLTPAILGSCLPGGLGLGVGTWKDRNISHLTGAFVLYAVTVCLALTVCQTSVHILAPSGAYVWLSSL